MITAVSVDIRIGWTSFGLMRKHVSTTRPTYLAAVLQDASKSYVAFLLCSVIVVNWRFTDNMTEN